VITEFDIRGVILIIGWRMRWGWSERICGLYLCLLWFTIREGFGNVYCLTTRTNRTPLNCSEDFHIRQPCKSGACILEFWRLSSYPSIGVSVMREMSVHFLRNDGQSIFLRVIDREYFIACSRDVLKFTYSD